MNRIPFSQRAAIAVAMLVLAFTVTSPISAAEDPKLSKPSPTEAQERDSQDAKSKDRAECRRIYQRVHRGAPGKGIAGRKVVRVECPAPRV